MGWADSLWAHSLTGIVILASACSAAHAQPALPCLGHATDLHPTLASVAEELADAARNPGGDTMPVTQAMSELPAPREALDTTVAFASGSAKLTPSVTRKLDDLGRALLAERQDGTRVRVEGFADTAGSRDANRDLAARRAQAVADYLELVGVPAEHLSIAASPTPLVPTPDGTALAANRRVRLTAGR